MLFSMLAFVYQAKATLLHQPRTTRNDNKNKITSCFELFAQSLTILFIFLKKTILLVVAKRCDAKARDYGESKKKTDFNIYSSKCGLKFASF